MQIHSAATLRASQHHRTSALALVVVDCRLVVVAAAAASCRALHSFRNIARLSCRNGVSTPSASVIGRRLFGKLLLFCSVLK